MRNPCNRSFAGGRLGLVLALLVLAAAPAGAGAQNGGSWTMTPQSPTTARTGHTATALRNGTVLVIGSQDTGYAFADLYDPVAGAFTRIPLSYGVREHAATLLPSGKVLVTGGLVAGGAGAGWGNVSTSNVLLYDPATRTFTPQMPMASTRFGHTATLLPNGKVLIAGGSTQVYVPGQWVVTPLASAELYDPGKSTVLVGNLAATRSGHTATALPNGKVLLLGGNASVAKADLYDPGAGRNGTFSSLTTPGVRYNHTATLLPNGKLYLAGGSDNSWGGPTRTTWLYDPDAAPAQAFTSAWPLSIYRTQHAAVLLPDGKVLVIGGAGLSPYGTWGLQRLGRDV